MSHNNTKESIEFKRPFLVITDTKGKKMCIDPRRIVVLIEGDGGTVIEVVSGSELFTKIPLTDLLDKIDEANHWF